MRDTTDDTAVPSLRDAATRYDEDAGTEERVGFAGADGDRFFASLHRPVGAPRMGLLVCSPLFSDFLSNYRREVMLARALAARGVAVLRFHYRGTGNSDGSPAAVTLDSLVRDARHARSVLAAAVGDRPIGVVGTRLGAIVAARVASTCPPPAPLVLWEPQVDAAAYFRQGFRAASMQAIKEQRGGRSPDAIAAELAEQGATDLMGYHLSSELLEQLTAASAVDVLGDVARRVLVVQFRQTEALRRELTELVGELSARGHDVDAEMAGVEGSWWFVPDEDLSEDHVVGTTLAWLERNALVADGEG